jgi:hypothetical protein
MLKPKGQLPPVKKEGAQAAGPPETKLELLVALLRLLVGGAVIGVDGLQQRSRLWQEEIRQATAPKMVIAPFSELEQNQPRHTLIGLLFETPEVIGKGLTKVGQASGKATGLVGKVLGPIANSWPARPVKRRYDKLVGQGEATLKRWAERGRVEEQASRALTEQAVIQLFDEVMDEVMIHLAHKPELRDLLQQQSFSMAGEVMDEVRQRTAGADALLERLARAMLRRSPHEAVVELPAPGAGEMEEK